MTSVSFKMADVNAGYLKVKLELLKRRHTKRTKQGEETSMPFSRFVDRIDKPSFGSMYSITRQSLVMPSSDPRSRIFYPIQKLMIDSYILRFFFSYILRFFFPKRLIALTGSIMSVGLNILNCILFINLRLSLWLCHIDRSYTVM